MFQILLWWCHHKGIVSQVVLAAAACSGVSRVFAIGGAQAIAALAYGTESVQRVDKIVGPGNVYVANAKKQVFGDVSIDMVAGPSEILVVCDGLTPPEWTTTCVRRPSMIQMLNLSLLHR